MAIRWSQTAISFRLNWVKLGQSVFEKNKTKTLLTVIILKSAAVYIRNAMLYRAQGWT